MTEENTKKTSRIPPEIMRMNIQKNYTFDPIIDASTFQIHFQFKFYF